MIRKAVTVKPLDGWIPTHDRRAEQFAGIVDKAPAFVSGAHVFFEWRMTPVRVPGTEPLMEIGGLGIHLRLSRFSDDDVAEQRHPPSGTEHVVRSLPADRRLDFHGAKGGHPVASECGHGRAGLDGSH
ncbi:hypothetical protein ACFYM2_14970 [Streptomyces sp. NPDC006711]|uniref:hypothetical protein n=1 Tax=Streptomyces sp. NPDC006711 TaxID=3364762 RepID=UPI0036B34D2C